MKKNISKTERVIRIIAGLVILALGFIYGSLWGIIGIVPLITGAIGYCPTYALLGVSTIKADKRLH